MGFQNTTTSTDFGPSAPIRLGVVPEELFSTSMFSKLLNTDMRNSDFITITVNDSNYCASVATIIGVIQDDALSLSFGSVFQRPFESVLTSASNVVAGKIGQTAMGAAKTIGTPVYNRYASVPIWQAPLYSNYEFKFLLIATSNAAEQVEKPLLLLSRMVLPKSVAQDKGNIASGLSVITPGPKLSTSISELSSAVSDAATNQRVDPNQVIHNMGAVSIQYGGLAFLSNCLISNVSYTVKNTRTIEESDGLFNFSISTGLPYYTYAEVSITVVPFFPNEYSADVGNSLGDIQLFYESSGVDKYSDFL